jgi:hypothetical protein
MTPRAYIFKGASYTIAAQTRMIELLHAHCCAAWRLAGRARAGA